MEDDDEFGDLYTDVLRPFAFSSSLSSASQPHQPSPAPPSLHSPIDLNLKSSNDDDRIVFGAPHSSSTAPNQTLAPQPKEPVREAVKLDLAPNSIAREDSAGGARVLEAGDVELPRRTGPEAGVVESEALSRGGGEGGVDLMDKDVNFDIEEGNTGIDDIGSEPIIPGLSGGGGSGIGSGGDAMVRGLTVNLEASRKDDASGGGGGSGENDWDSDSDDDLQIVLNDNNHGPMAMERGGIGGEEDDDDEDGDPLVIVADGELNQEMEAQEWGEDAAQAADGEKKETGDAGKVIGGGVHVGAVVAPKIGYSNHGYHPFHSQFKYVRPGAVPMSGAATSIPGGGPGQVRPLVNMGPMAGRGRGEWRPTGIKNASPMQKGFHSGFGLPAWGNNMAGRGFGGGGGLEFTLPSHKTIFDVDIESFEEKPWKYPGIDISDFFNFGLNEESWKDYCRQLEQLRLESTMQSKIRVYESGRTEQEYDPDLPPELAAATGVHDVLAENANSGKLDVGQSDLAKGSARVRPPIPTGRAIQVEGGYGERLPSIDTRPPRMRDSDAIIEIVLQDSVDDDSSTGNAPEQPDNETPREDFRGGDVAEEDAEQVDSEYFDGFPQAYNVRKRDLGRRMPSVNSGQDNLNDGDGISSFPPEAPVQISSSRGQTSGKVGTPYDERRTQERARDQSPHMAPSRSTRDGKFHDDQKEESVESLDGKHSPRLSSPVTDRVARESSVEQKDAEHDELLLADGSPVMEKDEMTLNTIGKNDTLKDGVLNKQKLSSRVEQPVLQEFDEGEDSKAARSSENSKARSGSSRDYQKWRDGADEEVIQEGRSTRTESMKRHLDDNEQGLRRKNRDGRQDIERSRMAVKGTEDYLYRDWDPSSGHQMHMKADGFNRRKERDNPEIPWQRRDDDPYNRRIRAEETRKRERGEEMGSRHRGKVRDGERSDKDEFLHSRKQLDNGNYRIPYDKEAGSRHRERDDGLKSRYENVDDYHGKRRKDEEYLRRDHADKEEILHGHRESTSRRKRERDEVLDPRKRDDQLRLRDNLEDHHSVRHKDEGWLQRERGERPPREREDWHRLKQSHEENLPKRERDEGRGALRGGRGPEEKALAGHSRAKEEYKGSDKEYQFKDTVRHSEQSKRRDRIEDENSHYRGREDVYPRGNQFSNDERRSRQERSSTRNDRAVSASDNQRVHDKKHRENTRKNKESEGGDHNAIGPSKRNREDQSGQINETGLKGSGDQGNGEREVPVQRHVSRKHREDVSSEDEQLDSKRGRSKLERWTSHAERDFSINSRPSSSLKFKESDRNINGASSEATKPLDESANTVEIVDNQHPSAEEKDAGDLESKDADTKPLEERHLEDTVEKLKKRSERFKLPLPSEKEVLVIKKIESEALPSAKIETPVESEIKPERPARKRRWVSN